MSIFALADLHLSGNPPQKPMDRFSPAWENHWDKIRAAWLATIREQDTVLIAGELHVSENTVKTHVKNIYSKAGVQNRTELMGLFLEIQIPAEEAHRP